MGKVLAFPGVDPALMAHPDADGARAIVIRGRPGYYTLDAMPGGRIAHPRLATITAARSYASRLCRRFPLTYWRVLDQTVEGRRQSGNPMLARSPFDGGDAA